MYEHIVFVYQFVNEGNVINVKTIDGNGDKDAYDTSRVAQTNFSALFR
ncbi:hypothetical protein JOC77_003977 [Peribacillus deserti]|uniref:Peptidase C51 domain-containing protein n=1 Tax=Peribacillus deserti TaxID=673318 RepID=A0ABS2QP51_9BACI|nr:hypothetical protein [Peribacillus deserti]